jgi:hypothetical protein
MSFRRMTLAAAAALALAASGCARSAPQGPDLDDLGHRFVVLAHQLGRHDRDFVDSYYGPPEWKTEAERDSLPLGRISTVADSLAMALGEPQPNEDALIPMRHRFLKGQLLALATRARVVEGGVLTFDEESRALFDVVAPSRDDASFARAIAELERVLPGSGSVAERLERFRKGYEIPEGRRDAVFQAALAEARKRNAQYIALPDSESFQLEFVRNQPWSGYNWYQGNYKSLIQMNVDSPIQIDRAIDLACHEGYPGHHVLNVLIEHDLVRGRGWQEFSLLPLYSPLALIGEGSASLAPDIMFTPGERAAFEKRVLFPLAGLDTTTYERYTAVNAAVDSLDGGGIEIARRFVDGQMTRDEAIAWRVRYLGSTRERAERSQRFVERYRSYVVNYGLGKAEVRRWLEANGGTAANEPRRWELFRKLLAEPHVPADLRASGSPS